MELVRRHLRQDGRLSEPLVRRAASALAMLLAGGENGFSWDYDEAANLGYDPHGWFTAVTEGRQRYWTDSKGKRRSYSACEDLPSAVYLRLCGCPPTSPEMSKMLGWCNRVEAGNSWKAGWNLLRIKTRMRSAWRKYWRDSSWDIQPGDAVQIMGEYGPHTCVLTALDYEADQPAICSHADYGQWHQPEGASRPDHSCRCHRDAAIARVNHLWCLNGKRIIGRLSAWELVRRVYEAQGETPLSAWVPPDFVGGVVSDNPYLPERA